MSLLIPSTILAIATIHGEAEGESFLGKVAIGKVIRNRMAMHYSSDGTVAGTVLAPWQFSVWNTTQRRRIAICLVDTDSPECQDASDAWTESAKPLDGFDGVVLYHTDSVFPPWASRADFVTQIGRHKFYREKK